MTFSLNDITVPSFVHYLKLLSDFLKKGESHFAGNEAALIDSRLIADMEALPYQIQRIEKTFPELQERIKWTIEILEKLDPKCMDGMEDKEITLKFRPSEKTFIGKNYVPLVYGVCDSREGGRAIGENGLFGGALGNVVGL